MLSKKLLCVSDAHASKEGIEALRKYLSEFKPDGLLIVGDLTTNGPEEYAEDLVNTARNAGVEVFAVGGNMDPAYVHDWLEKHGVSVHGQSKEFAGYKIVGVGGSNPTPFDTPVEYTEKEITEFADRLIDARTIFMPHMPPKNTCADLTGSGMHVGSSAVRELIEKHQPAVALCGHIHEAKGEEFLGRTKLIKIEPLMEGKAVLLELPSLKTRHLGD